MVCDVKASDGSDSAAARVLAVELLEDEALGRGVEMSGEAGGVPSPLNPGCV